MMHKVDRGIDLLNAKYPQWLDAIDLDIFNMKDFRYCVLGQLGDAVGLSYAEVIDRLAQTVGDSVEAGFADWYGFDLDTDHDDPWNELQKCWEQRIWELA